MTTDDSQYVIMLVLWSILLAVVALVLVPATLYRVRRLVRACKNIENNVEVTLKSATAIVGYTAPARGMLDTTIKAAGDVLSTAVRIDEHTATIESVLAARAAGAR